MRIGLAQINPIVGDINGNAQRIVEFSQRASATGCAVVVFPELALIGYPPKDLLLKADFINANLAALDHIAGQTRGIDVLVGYAERNRQPIGRPLHNAVALLRGGRVISRHFKTLLPTYDVFDESRYFEPGDNERSNNLISVRSGSGGDDAARVPTGLSICEDLWNDERLIARRLYRQNPISDLHQAGARLLINCSASPFVVDKHDFRRELFGAQVARVAVPLAYVNQVGGNDELVFDGNSAVFDAEGRVIAQAKEFDEDLLIVDIEPSQEPLIDRPGGIANAQSRLPANARRADDLLIESASASEGVTREHHPASQFAANRIERHSRGIEAIHKALLLGLRDYVTKCAFKHVLVGLSGGIDSAVVCALAVEALGAANVVGVSMPSRYSSDHSIADACALADNLGIAFHVVPIEAMHGAYEQTLNAPLNRLKGLTEENLQARIRGATLMAFSNRTGALLLTTGNKSEIAVGYCTLYGDMAGGLAVISDLPKTDVYRLAEHMNRRAARDIIPRRTIEKPPSAELAPGQLDVDSLPPYDVLDAILFRYVEQDESVSRIVQAGFEADVVRRIVTLVDRSEYKRRQAAPGLKVTSRAFGFGRRMPIAQRYDPLMTSYGSPAPEFPDVTAS